MACAPHITRIRQKHKCPKSSNSTIIEDAPEPLPPTLPQILPPSTLTVAPTAAQLLPPFELQPPSPPREQLADEPRRSIASESLAPGLESPLLRPAVDTKSLPSPPASITPILSQLRAPLLRNRPLLGAPQRNSLGDLKISARMRQAYVEFEELFKQQRLRVSNVIASYECNLR